MSNQRTSTTASQTRQVQTQETGDSKEVSAMLGFPSLFRYFWNLWSWTNHSPHSITCTYFGIIQGLETKTTFASPIAIVFHQKWNLKTSRSKDHVWIWGFPNLHEITFCICPTYMINSLHFGPKLSSVRYKWTGNLAKELRQLLCLGFYGKSGYDYAET